MIIYVKVIPNSSLDEIIHLGGWEYKIKIKAKAIDGKANEQLIELLSEHFKVKKNEIKIKNPLSRKKIIEIVGKESL